MHGLNVEAELELSLRSASLQAGEHGVGAVVLRHQRRERGQHRGAEMAVDPDRMPGGLGP
jgi:hypothetical protein